MAKKQKKESTKKGTKHIVVLNPDDQLEAKFQDLIAKGGRFDLKEASEYDNYSEFAMFVKECLEDGKFTKVELLEALFEDDAEYEYENFKDNYSDDDEGSQSNDAFVNYLQDEHGPYTAALICETYDEIYISMVEDCDEVENFYNLLKELALAITNVHPERIPHKTPTKEVMDIVSKLTTTTKPPTGNDQLVRLEDIMAGYKDKPSDPMKVLTEPMFKKL